MCKQASDPGRDCFVYWELCGKEVEEGERTNYRQRYVQNGGRKKCVVTRKSEKTKNKT